MFFTVELDLNPRHSQQDSCAETRAAVVKWQIKFTFSSKNVSNYFSGGSDSGKWRRVSRNAVIECALSRIPTVLICVEALSSSSLPPSPSPSSSSSSSLFLFFMNAGDWRQQKVGPKKLFLEATKSFNIFNETTERAKSQISGKKFELVSFLPVNPDPGFN